MRSVRVASMLSTATGRKKLSVDLTPRQVSLTILSLQAGLLVLVGLSRIGIEPPLLRALLAFVLLTYVPGFLILRLLGVHTESWTDSLVYTVGVSLVSLIIFGTVVNFTLYAVGISNPLSEVPLVLALNTIILGLVSGYERRDARGLSFELDIREATSPLVLSLALLPFLGIYGALALTRFNSNVLLLILYGSIACLPVLVLRGTIPSRLYPVTILAISLSLLLQNALTGQYLAWGDQVKEAALVLRILQSAYWNPGGTMALANKYSMLRITVLHPVYVLFSDVEVVWLFKVMHPLIFSVTPLALYRAYQRYTDETVAFLSAVLFMSLFSFFIVLSRNTRTATALLFLSLLALVIADDHLRRNRAQILAILFSLSVIVSHYGVSYILMLAFGLALPLTKLVDYLFDRDSNMVTSGSFVTLYVTALLAWYIYASPGGSTFHLLLGFGDTFVETLRSQFFADPGTSSASVRILTESWQSSTLDALKYANVLVGAFIALGLLVTLVRGIRSNEIETFGSEYFTYALIFLAIFGITFLPVERFNTARTYPTSLLFFAPFFVIGVRAVVIGVSMAVKRTTPFGDGVAATSTIRAVATVFILGYFLLNVGFISATITHEYSTNVLIEKERVMDDGHPIEKEYFYKQYPTVYGIESNAWLQANAEAEGTVYVSGWPGNLRGAVGHRVETPAKRRVALQVQSIPPQESQDEVGQGYVYLPAFSCPCLGNVVTFPTHHFGFSWAYTTSLESQWRQKDRIYTNGGSVIYYS